MQLHTTSRRRFLTGVGVTCLTIGGASVAAARPGRENFQAHLSGDEEVPSVETDAQGQAVFQVDHDGEMLDYKLIVANIENVRMAHIHLAPTGENGLVVAWLYPDGPPPQLIEGRSDGVLAEGSVTGDDLVGPLGGAAFEDLLDEMRDGNTYVNVHTLQNPDGEVRGQIH